MSPPTGAVPGAGWAEGVVVCVLPDAAVLSVAGWVAAGVFAGVVLDGVDCAHSPVVSANANPASVIALELTESALMTQPPAKYQRTYTGCAAPLHCIDASIPLFGINREE
jgi:hypothetical protein